MPGSLDMKQTTLGFARPAAAWALTVNVRVGGPQQVFVQQHNNGVVNIGAPAAAVQQPAAQQPAAQQPAEQQPAAPAAQQPAAQQPAALQHAAPQPAAPQPAALAQPAACVFMPAKGEDGDGTRCARSRL